VREWLGRIGVKLFTDVEKQRARYVVSHGFHATLRNSVVFMVVQALRHAARRKLLVMVEKSKGMYIWAAGPAITLRVANSPSRGD